MSRVQGLGFRRRSGREGNGKHQRVDRLWQQGLGIEGFLRAPESPSCYPLNPKPKTPNPKPQNPAGRGLPLELQHDPADAAQGACSSKQATVEPTRKP